MNKAASQRIAAKESLPLRHQFSWTLPANAIYGVCNLLLLVVLNKLGSTAAAGKYGFALAVTAPIFMFANLRLSTILASDMRPRVRLADYVQLRLSLLALAICTTVGLLVLPSARDLGSLLIVVACIKAAEAISDLCCGVQQRIERVDRIAISLVANGLAMIGSFAVVYYLSRKLELAAIALLAARMAVLVLYDIPVAYRASKHAVFVGSSAARLAVRSDRKTFVSTVRETWGQLFSDSMRPIVLTAASLGVTAALLSLASNIPRYIIAHEFGDELLGLFCSVAVILQAGNLVFRAIEQPVMPRLAKLLNEKNADGFWKLLISLLAIFSMIGIAGCALSFLVGASLLSWVFNPEFRSMGGVLALMALATAIGQVAGMIESSLIAARLTAIQVPMHFVTVLSCFLLGVVLIPRFELYGAVLTVSICRFPFMFVGVLLLRRKLRDQPFVRAHDSSEGKAA